MLEQASARLQQGNVQGAGPQIQGTGRGTEFASPEAEAAQAAVVNGKNVNAGIGPLDRESFNREVPSEGRQQGEAM